MLAVTRRAPIGALHLESESRSTAQQHFLTSTTPSLQKAVSRTRYLLFVCCARERKVDPEKVYVTRYRIVMFIVSPTAGRFFSISRDQAATGTRRQPYASSQDEKAIVPPPLGYCYRLLLYLVLCTELQNKYLHIDLLGQQKWAFHGSALAPEK